MTRRREALYSLVVFAAFLVAAETIVRRAWAPPGIPRGDDLFRYAAGRELLYEYRPGWRGERVLGGCKGSYRINGQGLRADRDFDWVTRRASAPQGEPSPGRPVK